MSISTVPLLIINFLKEQKVDIWEYIFIVVRNRFRQTVNCTNYYRTYNITMIVSWKLNLGVSGDAQIFK